MKAVLNLIKAHPLKLKLVVCLAAFGAGFSAAFNADAAPGTAISQSFGAITAATGTHPSNQSPTVGTGATSTMANAPSHMSTSETISLSVHGGRLVKLDAPATNVFVADPDIADVQVPSPTAIYVLGKKSGRTNVYALDQSGSPILQASVDVSYDVGAINALFNSELPNQKITVHSTPGAIVLGGEVDDPVDAQHAVELVESFLGQGDKVINQIETVAPNQVNLRVRIAEMSHTVAKQLGLNWNSATNPVNTFNDNRGTSFALSGSQPGPIANPDVLAFSFVKGNFDLLGFVDALAQQGIVTTLAEPNLTAVSGETASFLAGGEFPIPVAETTSNGVPTISVEYKQFGVGLNFTPTVLSPDRISLKVRPEVSQISNDFSITTNNLKIPGISVRRAETTVELASGQSFAIAGLMDNRTTNNLSKLPGIGDLPVLGPLFQSTSFQRNESELVIIVSPYIVKPIKVAQNEIPTPVDAFQPSSDVGRMFGQHLGVRQLPEGSKGPTGQSGQGLIGDTGFYY